MQASRVEIAAPDGAVPAYLAEPAGPGPFPAVVVIMEAFGLLPHIERVVDRLAEAGYVALAPDFYYRELPDNKVGYDRLPEAIALMQKVDDDSFIGDMAAVLDFLESRKNVDGSRIGVTGFCMGGRLSFLAACALPDRVAAAAPFYGGGIAGHLGQAEAIECPLLLLFGERDAFIPLEQVDQVQARLGELGKRFHVQVYSGAEHGFFCDERDSHDAEAAADAWDRVCRFFGEHLRG